MNVDVLHRARESIVRAGSGGRFSSFITSAREQQEGRSSAPEIGTSALVLDCVGRYEPDWFVTREILSYLKSQLDDSGIVSFFEDPVAMDLPADAETSSFVTGLLWELEVIPDAVAHRAADLIVSLRDNAGRQLLYFDEDLRSQRQDHASALNVITFLAQIGRVHEVEATVRWIDEVVERQLFLSGSRYYESPDAFIYFAARLVDRVPEVGQRWSEPIRHALRERIGSSDWPNDISMRVAAQCWLGDEPAELDTLCALQRDNGEWPADVIYRFGGVRSGYFSGPMISTAFATQAVLLGKHRQTR